MALIVLVMGFPEGPGDSSQCGRRFADQSWCIGHFSSFPLFDLTARFSKTVTNQITRQYEDMVFNSDRYNGFPGN
jgi:hypothetical protein